jgi:GGDEF domain-containing protein
VQPEAREAAPPAPGGRGTEVRPGAIAERIRANVESLAILTISIGGAIFPADGADVAALFQTADERLDAAKGGGRNRVVVGSYAVAAK